MEYKRVTERNDKSEAIYKTKTNADSIVENFKIHAIREGEVLDRLAELEDKIENGTIIELPCKVGKEIYYISMIWRDGNFIGEIYKANVSGFYISDGFIQIEDDIIYHYHNYGEEVFLTKAEAEAKLKYLKGEENETR